MTSLADAAAAIARTISPTDVARQSRLAEEWKRELLQGFLRGELRMFRALGQLPMLPDTPGALIGALTTGGVTLRELNRWLACIGTDVMVTEGDSSTVKRVKKPASTDPEVRAAAHGLADTWAREYFEKTDEPPTEVQVAKAIRKPLNETFGRGWADATIRRQCLVGWSYSTYAKSAQIAQE